MLKPNNMAAHAFLPDSHPSLNASMDDFEAREFSPTIPELPSQHSGFRSNNNSEYSETSSRRSYSPPAWRKAGSGWFKHQQVDTPSRGGFSASPPFPGADDDIDDGNMTAFRTARRIPLPESPIKGRSPSASPEPMISGRSVERDKGGGITIKKEERDVTPTPPPGEPENLSSRTPTQNNCKLSSYLRLGCISIILT